MHRGAPALWLDDAQVDLEVILNTDRRLGVAARKDFGYERHVQKRLHCCVRIRRRGKDIDVMNHFAHASKAAGIRYPLGMCLEIAAKLIRSRHCLPEKVAAAAAAMNLDAA